MNYLDDPLLIIAIYSFVFVIGIIVGSFLNVCIHRIPKEESIVKPASHCPSCKNKLKPKDNIPILSWLLLRGKCRYCGEKISVRYPVVELLNGVLYTAVIAKFGPGFESAVYMPFMSIFIIITWIDLDHMIIPDVFSLTGAVIALLIPVTLHFTGRQGLWPISITESFTGCVVGGGILLTIAASYYLLKKKEGMGIGDVKLMALIGALLGWKKAVMTIFLGSFLGTFIMAPFLLSSRLSREKPIPFGPFLIIGAVAALFFGDMIIEWYTGLIYLR